MRNVHFYYKCKTFKILVINNVCLYSSQVGFFHRKHKEELDQLIEDDKCELEGLTSRQAIEEEN